MQTRQRLGAILFIPTLLSLVTVVSSSDITRLIGMLVFIPGYIAATTLITPVLDKKDADSPYYQNHQPVHRFSILTNVFVALYISYVFGVYDVGAWRHLLLIGVVGGLLLQRRAVRKAVAYMQAHRND